MDVKAILADKRALVEEALTSYMLKAEGPLPGLPVGELHLHSILRGSESHRVAQLRAADPRGSRTEDLLPPLYEPELVAIGHDGLMLRGFESANGTGYVQEWRCVLQK